MTTADQHGAGRRGMTWPQMLALAIGVVYTLVGIVGFFITGFDDFAEHTDETILGFGINPLHNIVHLVIGLAGIALSRKLGTARTYGWLLAVGYGAAFVYGLFAAGETDSLNFLSINWADNWLHLASVLAGLAIALGPVKDATTRGRDESLRTR
ncbi:DUF4383 domain-containing protein [Modestobacter roseus]|uniref:Uncharacterized protein DUF4383 n=1 Tax=Modestobacter roseus TaxID=1181884 RepID=A0A562IV79_9ACTN|nr:DUF4383 domain-containing protein [Modestobacter roseus]MQA35655.1 DUF4383 domain-containing protein [Modestobacter roseus]TWH74858.1 uncharacterized protein DUF4383 [Modestobacter roseus]